MPKTTLQQRLNELSSKFAADIAQAVRADIAGMLGVASVPQRAERSAKRNGRARRVIRCPVPGCNRAGAGPRKSWFCMKHFDELSPAERKKAMAARKRAG